MCARRSPAERHRRRRPGPSPVGAGRRTRGPQELRIGLAAAGCQGSSSAGFRNGVHATFCSGSVSSAAHVSL
jgi:hypothetical protein